MGITDANPNLANTSNQTEARKDRQKTVCLSPSLNFATHNPNNLTSSFLEQHQTSILANQVDQSLGKGWDTAEPHGRMLPLLFC